ncbi:ABC transporter permease [Mucilaginibacter sp. PAMB04274]|uniref:ABC transporter permease n=1 Tax=Mucilaginibacter sp. PAMB04274 TaxID=3138568 RepID=UPI0031F6F729
MKGFLLSLQSEFYKSRKTLGFWSAILLPFILMFLVTIGFYIKADKLTAYTPEKVWGNFAGIPMGVMGSLLLPMFIIFLAYSVNNIEHRSDTWKTLFTLPIPKWSIYSAKFVYAVLLLLISLLLFPGFTILFGNLLGAIQPKLKFSGYHMEKELFQIYSKLFLASLGTLSLQFLMSLVWKDFLKPMGIGFIGAIMGIILVATVHWEYAYTIPYSQPLQSIMGRSKTLNGQAQFELLTKEVQLSLITAAVIFVAGYFVVKRKSIK